MNLDLADARVLDFRIPILVQLTRQWNVVFNWIDFVFLQILQWLRPGNYLFEANHRIETPWSTQLVNPMGRVLPNLLHNKKRSRNELNRRCCDRFHKIVCWCTAFCKQGDLRYSAQSQAVGLYFSRNTMTSTAEITNILCSSTGRFKWIVAHCGLW